MRGSNIFLKEGDIVYEMTPEEDGWIKVKTDNGEEGEIPIDCLKGNFSIAKAILESQIFVSLLIQN